MLKKTYVVAIHEDKLIDAIKKLNGINIKVVDLYELAGDNEGIWALAFKADKKHFANFLTYVRVEKIILKD